MRLNHIAAAIAGAAVLGLSLQVSASSHREAPFITGSPKVDGTDFYMFRSYEPGREDFVTLIANYIPLQDPYGGPNYFFMDPEALYEIHIDNSGNAMEDITFAFRFTNEFQGAGLPIGENGANVAVPLLNIGPIGPGVNDVGNSNLIQTYQVAVVTGDRRSGNRQLATNMDAGGNVFTKPQDYIGTKSFADYATYSENHIFEIGIPGCPTPGRVFVGQRREGFVVNLGQVFDLVNIGDDGMGNPLGDRDRGLNTVGDKNVTSIAMEVAIDCLTDGTNPVIGGWTTASKRQARVLNPAPQGNVTSLPGTKGPSIEGGAWTQVSRLGAPLVNEVVIGVPDKDLFNASHPADDLGNFASYVLTPTLPVLLNVLFGVEVPATPRDDLVQAFVTGVPGLTLPQVDNPGAGEILRLNTAVAVTPAAMQSDLAFLDCDLGGFPNGRRPIDDVVDIALNVVLGAIAENPNNLQTCDVTGKDGPMVVNAGAVVNDGARPDPADYLTVFPYLNTPISGSTAPASSPVAAVNLR
jgi:hypothetical protein